MKRTAFFCTTVCFLSLFPAAIALATPESGPILPTWKLLTGEQKRQFISGYQQGLRDSAQITGIALEYIEKNPGEAVSALKRVRSLYQTPHMGPDELVRDLDRFFNNPDNSSATLSSAVNAVVTTPREPYTSR